VITEVRALSNSATKAIICSTLLQTSYHLYQGTPMAVGEGATFLIFSIYYAKTNRIVPIILAHLYADVGGTVWYLVRN
jgi:membrane protease YdiL (CAAX protease family)